MINNLSSHKRATARKRIEAAAATLLFLPQHRLQPDWEAVLAPQGHAAKDRRTHSRRPWDLIRQLVDIFQPEKSPTTSAHAAMIQRDRKTSPQKPMARSCGCGRYLPTGPGDLTRD